MEGGTKMAVDLSVNCGGIKIKDPIIGVSSSVT